MDLLTATSAPLPWRCRVSLAHDIIRGLGHLHENRLIHRDLSSQVRFPFALLSYLIKYQEIHCGIVVSFDKKIIISIDIYINPEIIFIYCLRSFYYLCSH